MILDDLRARLNVVPFPILPEPEFLRCLKAAIGEPQALKRG